MSVMPAVVPLMPSWVLRGCRCSSGTAGTGLSATTTHGSCNDMSEYARLVVSASVQTGLEPWVTAAETAVGSKPYLKLYYVG